jgi:periplasmic protein TonB
MRRATSVSVGLHALAGLLLLGAALGEPARLPVAPAQLPPAITVSLASLPRATPAPRPAPVPAVEQPTVKQSTPRPPTRQPQPAQHPATPVAAAPAATGDVAAAPAATPPAAESAAAAAAEPAQTAGPEASAKAIWLALVRARLEAVKRYPPQALKRREQGTAVIGFEVGRDGRVGTHGLVGSSGSLLLDREAEELPERASPLPPMPEAMGEARISLTLPVSFTLR